MTNNLSAPSGIVFAGAGDLAQRTITELHRAALTQPIMAIARSHREIEGVHCIQGDLQHAATHAAIVAHNPRIIVVTLVPNGTGEQGYVQGYIKPLQVLLASCHAADQTPMVIFASSTGVYHQREGEWVDEETATIPTNFSGQCMLQAEQLLIDSTLPFCAVRFGGIYGPGRDYLIRQVQAGLGGGPEYTNRIHQQDAGRILSFLVQRVLQHKAVPSVLLACDDVPVSSQAVRLFIAAQLGLEASGLKPSASGRGGNKRCSNKLLRNLGFQLDYPSYKEGYQAALD